MESAQTKFFYKKLDEGLTLCLTSINAYIDVNMEKYKKLSKINFQDFRTLLNHSSGLAYILKRRAKEAQRSYKTPPAELFITDRVGVAARIYHKAGSSVGTYYTNLAFGPTYYDAQGDLHINMTEAVSFKMKDFLRFVDAVPSILKAIYDEVLKHRFTLENASNKSKATKQHFRRCQLCRAFHSDVDVNSKTDVDDADGKSAAPPSPSTSPSLTPCLYKVLEAIPADKGVFRLGASRSRNVDEVGEEEEGREANGVGVLRPIFGAKNGKKVRRRYDDDDDEEMSEDDDVGDDDGEDGDDIDEKRGVTPSYEELLALIAPSLKMFQKGGCKGDLHLRLLGQSIFMDKTYATSSKLSKKARKQIGFAFDDDDEDDEDGGFVEREEEEEEDDEEQARGRSRPRHRLQGQRQQQQQQQRRRQRKRHEREDSEDEEEKEKDHQILIEEDDDDDNEFDVVDSTWMKQRRGQKLPRQRSQRPVGDQQRRRQQLRRPRSRDACSEELEMVVVEKPSSGAPKHGPKRSGYGVKDIGGANGNGGKKIRFSLAPNDVIDVADEAAFNRVARAKKNPSSSSTPSTTLSAALKNKGRRLQPQATAIGVDGRALQPISEEDFFDNDDGVDDVVAVDESSAAKGSTMGSLKETHLAPYDESEAATALLTLRSKGALAGDEAAHAAVSEEEEEKQEEENEVIQQEAEGEEEMAIEVDSPPGFSMNVQRQKRQQQQQQQSQLMAKKR